MINTGEKKKGILNVGFPEFEIGRVGYIKIYGQMDKWIEKPMARYVIHSASSPKFDFSMGIPLEWISIEICDWR